jgi:CDP-diacylglycerol--glycerol-3-phosphate 3-phosphatidyltransferase
MLAYAALGRRRDADVELKGARFGGGGLDFLMHWFMWLLGPAERLFLRLETRPEALNVVGLAFGLASGALIAFGRLEWGSIALALGGAADLLDGRVARARGATSDFGKFLDSTVDRFVEAFVFLGFAAYLEPFPHGPLMAAAALAASFLVSYARARGESVGERGPSGLMQRAERLVLACLASLCDGALAERLRLPPGTLVFWTLAVIAAGSLLTAAHRAVAIGIALRRRGRRAESSRRAKE